MNQVAAFNHLLTFKDIADKLGFKFWLDGGTCLGAKRENGFLASDFDVDVGMYGENDNLIDNLIDNLKDNGFGTFHLKKHPSGNGKQISCIRNNISLDVFFYYKRGDRRFRVMFDITPYRTVRFIPCVLPDYLFKDFEQVDFMDYGVIFNLPKPCEEFLERQYGDWRKDKTKNEFHWQTDYECYVDTFSIFPYPKEPRRWYLTQSIIPTSDETNDFFIHSISEGYKLFPIHVNKKREIIDGNKRYHAYKKLGVPMIECIVNEAD